MTYNPIDHITHADLAEYLGTTPGMLTTRMKREGGPTILGSIRLDPNRVTRYYGRGEASAWLEAASSPTPEHRGEIVPPRDIYALRDRPAYRPSPQMQINQQRAAELYPHRLITPDGIGNGIDHGQNKRRFAL